MRYMFLLLFGIIAVQNCQTASEAAHLPPAPAAQPTPNHNLLPRPDYPDSPSRTLLIFYDESEKKAQNIEALSSQLLIALYQKAAPIVVSASLLYNVFNFSISTLSHEEFYKQCEGLKALATKAKKNILLYAPNVATVKNFNRKLFTKFFIMNTFNPEEWYTAEFKPPHTALPAFFLLVPRAYINQRKALPPSPLSKLDSPVVEELSGLCLESTNPLGSITQFTYPRIQWKGAFWTAKHKQFSTAPLSSVLSTCIASKGQYRAQFKKDPPQWIIYLTGHGNTAGFIANLTLPEFSALLQFLEKELVTQLFIYFSCSSAGENMKRVYKSRASEQAMRIDKIGERYSFPIISIGAVEAQLYSSFTTVFTTAHTLQFSIDFTSFTEQAEQSKARTYTSLLENIIPNFRAFLSQGADDLTSSDIGASQLPLLRPAHQEFFIPLIQTVELNDLFVASRAPFTQSLNLIQYIRKNFTLSPKQSIAVLLSAQYIPFAIQLYNPFTPAGSAPPLLIPKILSTLSGSDGVHIFEKLVIQNRDASPYLGLDKIFINSFHYAKRKIFIIRNLTVLSDDATETSYKNCIVNVDMFNTQDKKLISLIYRTDSDGQGYRVILPHAWKPWSSDYMKDYQELIKAIQNRYKVLFAQSRAIAGAQDPNRRIQIKEQYEKALGVPHLVHLNEQMTLLGYLTNSSLQR